MQSPTRYRVVVLTSWARGMRDCERTHPPTRVVVLSSRDPTKLVGNWQAETNLAPLPDNLQFENIYAA